MTNVRMITLLLAAMILLNAAIDAGVSSSKSTEPQSRTLGRISGRLQNRIGNLPDRLRQTGEALVSEKDLTKKRNLIETLSDSSLDSVGDLFVDLLKHEPVASVRLDLVNYLTRHPRPKLRMVFDGLAKSDPDAAVAVAALEGVRAIDVLELRDILTQRMQQSRSDGKAFEVFAEAEERWISLVQGAMLPGFLRVSPGTFSVSDQSTVRVAVLGDFGTGTDEQKQVAAAMESRHRQSPFDFAVTVGDNFYEDGMESLKDPRWQTWWEDLYGPLQIVFYAVLGNHDWHLFDSPAAQILYTERTKSWKLPAPYYSFVAGPVQFFALDTNEMSQKQLLWLDEELKRSRSTWKVVYGHHQIYSDGYHGDTARMIDQLLPLLKNRADIYLAGHEHDMQHLRPESGVHFLISGGGGRSVRPVEPSKRALFASATHGFTILEASPNRFDIRMVGPDSKSIHEYTLRK